MIENIHKMHFNEYSTDIIFIKPQQLQDLY